MESNVVMSVVGMLVYLIVGTLTLVFYRWSADFIWNEECNHFSAWPLIATAFLAWPILLAALLSQLAIVAIIYIFAQFFGTRPPFR